MRTISLKVPEELDAQLTRLARKPGRSKSLIVRTALSESLSPRGWSGRRSFRARARDLAGSVEAESDLSFEKRHLEGYGR